jgi:hypothetical protein
MTVKNWPGGRTWGYHATVTMTAAGGGDLVCTVSPGAGSEMILTKICIGPDDYAGAEQIDVDLKDDADNMIDQLMDLSLDNQQFNGPGSTVFSDDTDNSQTNTIGSSTVNFPEIISGTDKLVIDTTDLAQNETLTILFRARYRGKKPTVTWTTSGTKSESVSYNKTI